MYLAAAIAVINLTTTIAVIHLPTTEDVAQHAGVPSTRACPACPLDARSDESGAAVNRLSESSFPSSSPYQTHFYTSRPGRNHERQGQLHPNGKRRSGPHPEQRREVVWAWHRKGQLGSSRPGAFVTDYLYVSTTSRMHCLQGDSRVVYIKIMHGAHSTPSNLPLGVSPYGYTASYA